MNWNVFWTVYLLTFAVACFIVAYAVGWKSIFKKKRCTRMTTGKVIRRALIGQGSIHLPLVEYYDGDKRYRKRGPTFKAYVIVSKSGPYHDPVAEASSNVRPDGELPDVLKVKTSANSMASISPNLFRERYKVGTEVPVYYNPNKPRDSYVERYAGTILFFSFWLPLIAAVALSVGAFFCVFGPALVMK